jgi:hypothetical protein
MRRIRRITLDWKKLFAFEQAEPSPPSSQNRAIESRIGAKIGDKDGLKNPH